MAVIIPMPTAVALEFGIPVLLQLLKKDLHLLSCPYNSYSLWNLSLCLFYTARSVWCLIIDQGPPLISIILSLWRSRKFGSCLPECGSRLNQGLVSPELNQSVSFAAGSGVDQMRLQWSPLWTSEQSRDEPFASPSHGFTASIFVKHVIDKCICFSWFCFFSLSWHFCFTIQTFSRCLQIYQGPH